MATTVDENLRQTVDAMLKAKGKPMTTQTVDPGGVPPAKQRDLITVLQDMATQSTDDYADFIGSIRRFVDHKRAELDRFERLMGTK
ncbi:MAG TPA: hypothetical protein VKB76_11185 [Ktedonobacterales bacterium]|nr:hypothetical protein [Ktedonobacterales bacterium]